jgi:26S proteasome regulatory subunit N2
MGAQAVSSQGLLALLEEDQNEIKMFALTKLNETVNEYWAEIANSVSTL